MVPGFSMRQENEESALQERRIVRETSLYCRRPRHRLWQNRKRIARGEGAQDTSPTSMCTSLVHIAPLACTPYISIVSRRFNAKQEAWGTIRRNGRTYPGMKNEQEGREREREKLNERMGTLMNGRVVACNDSKNNKNCLILHKSIWDYIIYTGKLFYIRSCTSIYTKDAIQKIIISHHEEFIINLHHSLPSSISLMWRNQLFFSYVSSGQFLNNWFRAQNRLSLYMLN